MKFWLLVGLLCASACDGTTPEPMPLPPVENPELIIAGSVLSGLGGLTDGMNVTLEIRSAGCQSPPIYSTTFSKVNGLFTDTLRIRELPARVCVTTSAQPDHRREPWATLTRQLDDLALPSDQHVTLPVILRYDYAVVSGRAMLAGGVSAMSEHVTFDFVTPEQTQTIAGTAAELAPLRVDSGRTVTVVARYDGGIANGSAMLSWRTSADSREMFHVWIARSDPSAQYFMPPAQKTSAPILESGVTLPDSLYILRWQGIPIWSNAVF